jgi:chromosome segregation ATPase
MPMWSETYKSGFSYYREHKASRSLGACPAAGGSIPCKVADDQVGKLIEAIELGPRWLEEVLAIISLKDAVETVKKKRQSVQEHLRRLAKTYNDLLVSDEEYERQKKILETELRSLVVPAANAAEEAGKLILNLKELWSDANLEERWKLLLSMLDAVYFDTKKTKSIVAIRPKPPFRPIFQVAVTRADAEIRIIKEPSDFLPKDSPVFLVETGES